MKLSPLFFCLLFFPGKNAGAQDVGIGTTDPKLNLHLHTSLGSDMSMLLTHSGTGDGLLRGARLRLLQNNIHLINYEPGKIMMGNAGNAILTVTPTRRIGINEENPLHTLHIESSQTGAGIYLNQVAANGTGIFSLASQPNSFGIRGFNNSNAAAGTHSTGMYGGTGTGSAAFSPSSNYGVIGESINTAKGVGVLGASFSGSTQIREAAVVGLNLGDQADSYGIIGNSAGSTGAGTVGITYNATSGVLGYATGGSTGPAIKAVAVAGSSAVGLELQDAAIKVSGTNKSVFQVTTTSGNTSGHITDIPLTTMANNASDMLIVTAVYSSSGGVYCNFPIGVWWNGTRWTIFNQTLNTMPLGAVFNVMVVKQ